MPVEVNPQVDASAERGARWQRWSPLALLFAGVLVYLNSLPAPFIFDDTLLLKALAGLEPGEEWAWFLSTRRALVYFTMWLNYQVGAVDGVQQPGGYHLVNMAIHIIAGLALYGCVRRTLLLPKLRDRFADAAAPLAFTIALVWLIHPLNTQAVTYIVQRAESMMGMFMLLTLYASIRALEGGMAWRIAAVLCCALGVVSKEVMVVAPVLIVLYDWTLTQSPMRDLLRRRGLLYAGLFATLLIYPLLSTHRPADESAGFGLEALTWWQYALTQPLVILKYLKLSVLPHPLVLDYMHKAEHTRFVRETPWLLSFVQVATPTIVVLTLVAASGWAVLRRKSWGFLAAAFFLVLTPTSSILPIADVMVEHRMYVPLIAVVALIVLLVDQWMRRMRDATARRIVAGALLAVAATTLAALTINRNFEYRDEVSIWQTVTERVPHNPRGWNNLGNAYLRAGDPGRAYECWMIALDRAPQGLPDTYVNLARVLLDHGQVADARSYLEQAIRLQPKNAEHHDALAEVLLAQGELDAAAAACTRAIALQPTFAKAHNRLGTVLLARQEPDDAVAAFDRAIALDPSFIAAHVNKGAALIALKRFDAAIEQYHRALELDDTRPEIYRSLGDALVNRGDLSAAEANYLHALRLNANDGMAVLKLAGVAHLHAQAGRFNEAARVGSFAADRMRQMPVHPRDVQAMLAAVEAYRAGRMPGPVSPPDSP